MVRIISQNVRGLNEYVKRKSIFHFLREKADIVCLQETHATNDCQDNWVTMWGGEIYWSHGNAVSRGVNIMIKRNSPITVKTSFADTEGRLVGIVYEEDGESFVLINIYAPNNDSPEFFVEAFKYFEQHNGHCIIVGDFNLVLNDSIDRNEGSTEKHWHAQRIVKDYMEDTYMTDIW